MNAIAITNEGGTTDIETMKIERGRGTGGGSTMSTIASMRMGIATGRGDRGLSRQGGEAIDVHFRAFGMGVGLTALFLFCGVLGRPIVDVGIV